MRQFDQPGRSPVYAQNGAAATSHPLGTATALTVLRQGGNAVDAAIAASATLAVVEPHMTGIGGDCFAIVCEPDGSLHGLNGSGRSARAAELGWYLDNGFDEIGSDSPHSITVPGALRAWEALHQRFGSMDFVRLFDDAVRYATEGYVVAPRVAHDWALHTGRLARHEGARQHYLADGKAPATGEIMRSPALAATLERIARHGADAFYEGEIAEDIVATVRAAGGLLELEDLSAASADWVEPITADFCGYQVHEIPPNGQGLTALILMKLVERLDLPDGADGGARYFLEAEAGRIAYALRDLHIADPAHMQTTPETLLDDGHIDRLAQMFDPSKRNETLDLPRLPGSDTVYLSVADRDGRCISFINSIYSSFGCAIVTAKTGIALQNRGSGFVVKEGHPNAIGPAKRPLHTIIPAMVTRDGKPEICFGVMGGSYQPMGQTHVLANMLRYGMDPQEALDHPRMFWNDDGALVAEAGISAAVRGHLTERGHAVETGGLFGGGQIIRIDQQRGVYVAASDPRKDGHAAGY